MRLWFFLTLLILVACAPEKEPLRIAVAANLGQGIDSIANYFEEFEGIECEVIVGASGELTTQIENGAPFDFFISADEAYATRLYNADLSTQPELFLTSRLVCIKHVESNASNAIDFLLEEDVNRIGIADPDIAPFGKAAKNYLVEKEIWKTIESKVVYAESVTHLNNMIESYSLDAAFTSMSFLAQMDFVYQFYEMEDSENTLVNQYLVEINRGAESHPDKNKFAEFLFSEQAYKILAYFGY